MNIDVNRVIRKMTEKEILQTMEEIPSAYERVAQLEEELRILKGEI